MLYTSLQFVEGVYKPQRACVGWASVTESCLETCMQIKRTCLDGFPPGHHKMFERTLDIILLFVLAISNNINLFPSFFLFIFIKNKIMLFPMKTLGKLNYFTQTVQILKFFKKLTKIIYTWHVHKTEKFRYPINDVILKRGKELVKTVLVTLSGKVLF